MGTGVMIGAGIFALTGQVAEFAGGLFPLAFLIAAIGYIVALAATVFEGDGAALTVLVLGIVLLLLGAFWEKIRARVLRLMPGFVPLHRLPPSQV